MPRALDPDATFDVVLLSDRDKEDPPTFTFRYLSNRDWRRLAKVYDSLDELGEEGIDALLDELEGVLKMELVGWRNLTDRDGSPIPFKLDDLDRVVDVQESVELMRLSLEGAKLSVTEGNGSGSPSPSDSDESASDAAHPAPAPAAPASESPSSSSVPGAGEQDADTAETPDGSS